VSRATALAALLTVSLLAACGSDDSGKSDTTAKAPATKTTATAAAPKVSVEQATANCHTVADPLVGALHAIDDDAGLSQDYGAYRTALRKARVTFRQFDFDVNKRAGNCIVVVVAPATEALNHYGLAEQAWSRCDKDDRCGKGSAASKLADEWKTAGDLLVNAESAFDTIQTKTS
jgi:hypothetical protein